MSYRIDYRPGVRRDMKSLPRAVITRIDDAILELAGNPRPAGCVKLAGHDNLWRIRVGQYRIIYEIQDDRRIVIILIVAHRRESYRGL